jgi:uncharacterized protein (DUF2062 family)
MPRRFFRRVSGGYLRNERPWFLKPFQAILSHPTFFSVSRRSVAGAIWIGVFIAMLPLPGQTLIALALALLLRVNLPIAGLATWVTNPVTMGPIFFYEYNLGALMLDIPSEDFDIELSWEWVTSGFISIWKPLLLGSLISATIISAVSYIVVSATWRLVIAYRYKRRHINNSNLR